MAHDFDEQRVLAVEVVVKRLPRDLRAGGDTVDAHLIAFFVKSLASSLKQALAGTLGRFDDASHGRSKRKSRLHSLVVCRSTRKARMCRRAE